MAAIALPAFDPVALSLFGLKVHWYGLLWALGILQFYWVCRLLGQPLAGGAPVARVADSLVFWVVLGGFLGGRIGYVLIYGTGQLAEDPLWAFRVWEGGMSFHGGLVGAATGVYVTSRHEPDVGLLRLADLAALGTPLGLALGRLGNLINGELWGRPSGQPWAVTHPAAGEGPRHPSQVYELLGEGLLLFAVLYAMLRLRPAVPGLLASAFVCGYALVRFALEFFREPDAHIGYLALGLTAGQWLSVPMLAAGLALLAVSLARR